jgi:DNA-binding MarR family transcriptional regulator
MTSSGTRSDAGLATTLRISVSRLARRLRVERTAPGQAEPVLSDTQFAALATLEKHGAMSPGELAGHERVQPPSMTRVIAALEEWQLVTRAAHASDRRQVVLTVTPAGRVLVAKARRRRDAWLARRLNELTPQERATLRAAAPILEKLSQA